MTANGDPWSDLAERFVVDHYGSRWGRVHTHVIDRHLRLHLPPAPATVVDVGGGAGNQSIPLASVSDHYRRLSRLFHLVGRRSAR